MSPLLTPADLTAFDLAHPMRLHLPDEAATARLGALIAPHLRRGDVVYLSGDLGACMTSLSRCFILSLTTADQDVPSPTFTLIQSYDTPHFALQHLDLYRIETPEETWELGLDDLLVSSVLLIEWPERLAYLGFDDRLDIVIQHADKTNFPDGPAGGRIAALTARGQLRDS